jgi:hypothetical protein
MPDKNFTKIFTSTFLVDSCLFRKAILLLLFSMSTIYVSSQVTGIVIDSAAKQPIELAVVGMKVKKAQDTVYTMTNAEGQFTFDRVPASDFSILIFNAGYMPVGKFITVGYPLKKLDLGTIILANKITVLGEVIVQSPPIIIKVDTIEYRASAFKVKPHGVVEDLLKKLPGVQVDKDGNIKAQGKEVTKVKVNGKDFFEGDPKTATQELPANIVDKVQIIDDYGDQATVSGIKDNDPDKIINLQLKKDKNTGYFGRATVGVGDQGRYLASINANYFNDTKQISVFTGTNNTNQSLLNFGGNIPGISTKTGQGGMSDMIGSSQLVNSYAGTTFQSGNIGTDGITTNNSAGLNYRDQWSKGIIVYGSYSYGNKNTKGTRVISQQNIFSEGSYINNQNSVFDNDGNNHRFSINLEYKLDSFNYLKVSPAVSYSSSHINNNTLFNFFDTSGKTSDGYNDLATGSTAPNVNGNVLYNHRFHKRGRNFSVNLNVNFSENKLHQDVRNNIVYYVTPGGTANRFLYLAQQNSSHSNGIRLTYSEPISKTRSLDVTLNHHFSYTRNDKQSYDVEPSSGMKTINPVLSNDYENNYYTTRGNITVRTTQKNYNYTLGVSIQPVELQGFSNTKDSAYRPVERINIFPVARFAYNFTKGRSLNIYYRGDAQQPALSQLQDVTDLSNPQYQVKGNPLLKPAINHNLNVFFNDFNLSSGRVFFSGITFTTIQNQIVNNIVQIGTSGSQLSIPKNVNGFYSGNAYYNYSKPYEEHKYIFSLNGSVFYNHDVNLIDSLKTFGNNYLISQGVNFEFNEKEWLTFNAGAVYNLNSVKYNTGKFSTSSPQNQDYSSWTITSSAQADLPGKFVLKYDLDYTFNHGLTEIVGSDIALMNASIEKLFLKNQNGSLKLQGFDLFNQNSSVTRIITANSIIDSRNNRLQRYFLVSFTYRMQKF